MADYHWPPANRRALIGKREKRIDGPVKSSGRAKAWPRSNKMGFSGSP